MQIFESVTKSEFKSSILYEFDAAAMEHRDDPVKDLEAKKNYVRQLARELGWEIRES